VKGEGRKERKRGGGGGGGGTSGLIGLSVERFIRKKRKLLATLFLDGHVLRL